VIYGQAKTSINAAQECDHAMVLNGNLKEADTEVGDGFSDLVVRRVVKPHLLQLPLHWRGVGLGSRRMRRRRRLLLLPVPAGGGRRFRRRRCSGGCWSSHRRLHGGKRMSAGLRRGGRWKKTSGRGNSALLGDCGVWNVQAISVLFSSASSDLKIFS
jgi:hypothetical protein